MPAKSDKIVLFPRLIAMLTYLFSAIRLEKLWNVFICMHIIDLFAMSNVPDKKDLAMCQGWRLQYTVAIPSPNRAFFSIDLMFSYTSDIRRTWRHESLYTL